MYYCKVVSKERHSKNEINKVLKTARRSHFTVIVDKNGHRWGWISCGICDARFSIASTPANPGNHAKVLRSFVSQHSHQKGK